jgi:hypothetical protein
MVTVSTLRDDRRLYKPAGTERRKSCRVPWPIPVAVTIRAG